MEAKSLVLSSTNCLVLSTKKWSKYLRLLVNAAKTTDLGGEAKTFRKNCTHTHTLDLSTCYHYIYVYI